MPVLFAWGMTSAASVPVKFLSFLWSFSCDPVSNRSRAITEPKRMLAFDLETTGLDPQKDQITCAAVYDPDADIERVFMFAAGARDDPEEFMLLLDQADRLCAFNGASFDLAFISAQLAPAPQRVACWRLKLHDVFVACKWGLGVTFPLQSLLDHNCLQGKTGSGKEAIDLFKSGRLEELGEYCLHDTRMTHRVSSLPFIRLPKSRDLVMRPDGCFAPCL